MTVHDDAAAAIVAELDALGRFSTGPPGAEDLDSGPTETSMEIISRNIPHPDDVTPAYYATLEEQTTVSGDTYTTFTWATPIYYDDEVFTVGPVARETGVYTVEFTSSIAGGSGTRAIQAETRADGATIDGSVAIESWNQAGGGSIATLSLFEVTSVPVSISAAMIRTGGGGGTIQTVANSTSILIRKLD
jgi:hypothetical protein